MSIQFSESEFNFIQELFNCSVNFLVIGGMAVQYYNTSRNRDDIDIWIDNKVKNLNNFIETVENVVGVIPKLTIDKLEERNVHISLRDIGYNFDVLTTLNSVGSSFADSFVEKEILKYKGLEIPILNKKKLILSKLNSPNIKDIDDIKLLQKNA